MMGSPGAFEPTNVSDSADYVPTRSNVVIDN